MILEKLYKALWNCIDKSCESRANKTKDIKFPKLEKESNIQYFVDKQNNRFDLFYPKNNSQKKLPTIINIHGGGYVGGSKEYCELYCKMLANNGYTVLNMEYTRCDGKNNNFYKQINDVFQLFHFIEKNENFSKHIDFNNIFLAGDSAGAHIAGIVSNIQTNDLLKQDFSLCGGPKIKGLIFVSPMLGAYKFCNFPIRRNFENVVYGKNGRKEPLKEVCHNLDIMSPNFPPCIVFSASNDFIKLHAKMFCKQAKELNLSVQNYTLFSGKHLTHDCVVDYPRDNENRYCINLIDNFVKDAVENKFVSGVKNESIKFKEDVSENINQEEMEQSM